VGHATTAYGVPRFGGIAFVKRMGGAGIEPATSCL
jgi:hypothetical protein